MHAELVRCDNPGPMELEGTNTWVLQAAGADSWVVVDPGPDGHREHGEAVARGRNVELVLVTHHHPDHVGGLDAFHALTGAPSRGFDAAYCRDAPPLADHEEFDAAGLRFRVLHTPGHTPDSVSFLVTDGTDRVVLTGDSVLGRGTTMLDDTPGAVRNYLHSLDRLAAVGTAALLPGHGPDHRDLGPVVAAYQEHRRHRLDAIRRLLRERGLSAAEADPEAIVDELYAGTRAQVRVAAGLSVRAQLAYLSEEEPASLRCRT